jgi:hypothetical protein
LIAKKIRLRRRFRQVRGDGAVGANRKVEAPRIARWLDRIGRMRRNADAQPLTLIRGIARHREPFFEQTPPLRHRLHFTIADDP